MLFPRGAGAASGSDGGNPEFLSWPSSRPTRLADAVFLAKLVRRHRPDCLIANFAAVNWMIVIGWLFGVRCRIAFFHTLSSQLNKDTQTSQAFQIRMLRFRKRQVFKLATHMVANSKAAQQDAQNSYGFRQGKCNAQPLGLADPAKWLPLALASEREDMVVCAGRLHPSKGQDVLIKALALNARSWGPNRVLFLGSGPRLDYLRQLAGEKGVADRCVFAGVVSHDEVLRHMSRAKAVVVPSRSEAFGYVNLEALAVGTPVIASKVGGISEIVRDGVDGYLVPPDDPETLAGTLVKLLGNPALRELLGRHGRQRFLECYELSKVVIGQTDWLESLSIN
jgi:glycosyltransferase involved in cell wall biosynthesis